MKNKTIKNRQIAIDKLKKYHKLSRVKSALEKELEKALTISNLVLIYQIIAIIDASLDTIQKDELIELLWDGEPLGASVSN